MPVYEGTTFWYVRPNLTLDGTLVTSLAQVDSLTATLFGADGMAIVSDKPMEAAPGLPGAWRVLFTAPTSQMGVVAITATKDGSEGYWEDRIWFAARRS